MTTAQMDDANRAMCYALRHPGPGQKPLPYTDIRKVMRKKNGKHPSIPAMSMCVAQYKAFKHKTGRKPGSFKTTKQEDKQIMKAFHKMRPPGHGVFAWQIKTAMPKKLAKKVSNKTIIRRVGDKGYHYERKSRKTDLGLQTTAKRMIFFRKHAGKNEKAWVKSTQAVGDLKEFTWYPEQLQPQFKRLRAPATYMTKAEKKLPAFQRPKKWFPKTDWEKVKKQKVLGLTASNGKHLNVLVPTPFTGELWADIIKKKVGPWLKKTFPTKKSYHIILDGEKLLHCPAARAAMVAAKITVERPWPNNSPDLNPQENVWAIGEKKLRSMETGREPFELWKKLVLKAFHITAKQTNPPSPLIMLFTC